MFKIIQKALEKGSLLGCSIDVSLHHPRGKHSSLPRLRGSPDRTQKLFKTWAHPLSLRSRSPGSWGNSSLGGAIAIVTVPPVLHPQPTSHSNCAVSLHSESAGYRKSPIPLLVVLTPCPAPAGLFEQPSPHSVPVLVGPGEDSREYQKELLLQNSFAG